MLYNTKTNSYIYGDYIVTDKGTFFLDVLSKEQLNELGIVEKEIETTKAVEPTREEKIERLKQEFLSRVDTILNSTAHAHGYDNINTAVSYAGYENKFQAEGISFGKWRSSVYEWGYGLLEKIIKGEVDIDKTNLDEVLKAMPTYQGVGK